MSARPEPDPPRFPANRVRELRLARGLSQAKLAARVGVDGSTVHRVERGDSKLTWAAAERLGSALDVPPGDLFVPPRRRTSPIAGLARRLADLTARDRNACLVLARAIAAGRAAGEKNRCKS